MIAIKRPSLRSALTFAVAARPLERSGCEAGQSRAFCLERGNLLRQVAEVTRKLRQPVKDLENAGFTRVPGGKGSHRKFKEFAMASQPVLSLTCSSGGLDSSQINPSSRESVRYE
jgi:hypothetical protein